MHLVHCAIHNNEFARRKPLKFFLVHKLPPPDGERLTIISGSLFPYVTRHLNQRPSIKGGRGVINVEKPAVASPVAVLKDAIKVTASVRQCTVVITTEETRCMLQS